MAANQTLQRTGHSVRLCITLAMCAALSGCLVGSRNVTDSEEYQTDYRRGMVYALKRDAMLYRRRGMDWLTELMRNRTPHRLWPAEGRPGYNGDDLVGPVPAGTGLRFERLLYVNNFEYDEVLPIARMLDGPYRGRDVDLSPVSRGELWRSYQIDPEWVEAESAAVGEAGSE